MLHITRRVIGMKLSIICELKIRILLCSQVPECFLNLNVNFSCIVNQINNLYIKIINWKKIPSCRKWMNTLDWELKSIYFARYNFYISSLHCVSVSVLLLAWLRAPEPCRGGRCDFSWKWRSCNSSNS